MPSSAADFRRLARREITLPSGLIVEIRKVPAIDFLALGDVPLPKTETETENTQDVQDVLPFYDLMIVKGCVAPPFVARHQPDTPDTVNIEDLDFTDYQALALNIATWSGLTAEVAQQAQSFRAQTAGEAPEADGRALRDPAIQAS